MQTITDETLVLLYYGELEPHAARAVRARLADDRQLAARFTALTAQLEAITEPAIPERDAGYGRRVWARVDAALDATPARRPFAWLSRPLPRLAGGMFALAAVAVLAFQLGRLDPVGTVAGPQSAGNVQTGNTAQARLLEASLARHFDSADRLLTEIANNQSTQVDIESEKRWAKVLLVSNRLYRFAAEEAGQPRIAQLLADMEPVLIELANGAGQLTPGEYRNLRQSIDRRDLVFKVRSANLAMQPRTRQL